MIDWLNPSEDVIAAKQAGYDAAHEELQAELDASEQASADYVAAFKIISSYALTCQRKNAREWMFGLEDAINRAAKLVGDPDRAVCGSDGMALWLKKGKPE